MTLPPLTPHTLLLLESNPHVERGQPHCCLQRRNSFASWISYCAGIVTVIITQQYTLVPCQWPDSPGTERDLVSH